MRGRKPAPTKLKILRGVQNDRINHSEPVPPRGKPEPPEYLDKLAKEEWQRICGLLEGMNLLSLSEGPALGLYCECHSKWRQARHEILKYGMVMKSTTEIIKRGQVVGAKEALRVNPAINIEIQMARMMKDLLIEFGLTPSARSRIKNPYDAPKDRLAEHLDRIKIKR